MKFYSYHKIFLVLVTLSLLSCEPSSEKPEIGLWRATMTLQDGKELPFQVTISEENKFVIKNGEEAIEITDITYNRDSIVIAHPFFEGIFKGIYSKHHIAGDFIKPSLDRVVPFRMEYGKEFRFERNAPAIANIDGTWEMIFSAHSEENRYIARGVFEQFEDGSVSGNIQTETGDYRFLEGIVEGNTLKLSTFDGAHAFLFEAEIKDSLMYGYFYSGNHWKEPFSGVINLDYELPDPESLTFLKEGYESFDFSFPDEQGRIRSLTDEDFKDKVVVVQIMGTWCPNCMEESEFYANYSNQHQQDSLAFVSLAFEYARTEQQAWQRINKLKSGLDIKYPILLAQYGSSSKQKANDKLPMLNHVLSYPTTIFIDKKGQVRKIHTGFNGKATGEKYEQFTQKFDSFVTQLLKE